MSAGPITQFISEPIRPIASSIDTRGMAIGAPGLPQRFDWRDERLEVARVLSSWRESAQCTHGSDERYAKKHWFEVTLSDGRFAKLYFERQALGKRLERWWLYTIASP